MVKIFDIACYLFPDLGMRATLRPTVRTRVVLFEILGSKFSSSWTSLDVTVHSQSERVVRFAG